MGRGESADLLLGRGARPRGPFSWKGGKLDALAESVIEETLQDADLLERVLGDNYALRQDLQSNPAFSKLVRGANYNRLQEITPRPSQEEVEEILSEWQRVVQEEEFEDALLMSEQDAYQLSLLSESEEPGPLELAALESLNFQSLEISQRLARHWGEGLVSGAVDERIQGLLRERIHQEWYQAYQNLLGEVGSKSRRVVRSGDALHVAYEHTLRNGLSVEEFMCGEGGQCEAAEIGEWNSHGAERCLECAEEFEGEVFYEINSTMALKDSLQYPAYALHEESVKEIDSSLKGAIEWLHSKAYQHGVRERLVLHAAQDAIILDQIAWDLGELEECPFKKFLPNAADANFMAFRDVSKAGKREILRMLLRDAEALKGRGSRENQLLVDILAQN